MVPKGSLFLSVFHVSLLSCECLRHRVATWRTICFSLLHSPLPSVMPGTLLVCKKWRRPILAVCIWTISVLWALLIPLWRLRTCFDGEGIIRRKSFLFSATPQDFAHFRDIESVTFWRWAVEIRARLVGGPMLFVSTSSFRLFTFPFNSSASGFLCSYICSFVSSTVSGYPMNLSDFPWDHTASMAKGIPFKIDWPDFRGSGSPIDNTAQRIRGLSPLMVRHPWPISSVTLYMVRCRLS